GRRPHRGTRPRRRRLPRQALRPRRAPRPRARRHPPPWRALLARGHLRRAHARSRQAPGHLQGRPGGALGARVRRARGAHEGARRGHLAREARGRRLRLGRGGREQHDRGAPAPPAAQARAADHPERPGRGVPDRPHRVGRARGSARRAAMRSIRANLVLWLVSALVVGVLAVLAATYALTRNEVGRLFDEELRQVALAVHLRLDWEQPSLRIARPGFSLSLRAYDDTGRVHFESALPSLPADLPQTFAEGFRTIATAQGPWRVFTHVAEEGIVQVGQPLETRDALARDVTFRALIPMALLIPLVALVTPWALRRGLRPLAETSRRVSDRDAARLDPLPDDNVPTEL